MILMNKILYKKIFQIGKKVFDELQLHETEIVVSIKNTIFNDYLITIGTHPLLHISDDELKDFRKNEYIGN